MTRDDTCTERHCDDGDCTPCEEPHVIDRPDSPVEVARRWHDEESGHSGAYPTCDQQPCAALRDALEDW